MPAVHTPVGELGSPCPDFQLLGVDGHTYEGRDFLKQKAFLVMFICNHCPYVIAVEERLIALTKYFANQPVAIAAICSNDSDKYPADSFANMKLRARDKNYPFPYLHDPTQKTARDFGAVCTPDFFLFDSSGSLAYRGRLDDSWKDPAAVKSQDLKLAIEAVLSDKKPTEPQRSSMGCSIKWKPEHLLSQT